MSRVSHFLPDSMWALPAGIVAALVWSNTLPDSYYLFAHALSFFVNDIGLAFFLGLVTKEVVEATLPGGSLHPWRRAAVPLVAAIGGTLVPAAIFMLMLHTVGDLMLAPAWVATCAVDIAAVYVAGRLIMGRHAGMPFLLVLSLAINSLGLLALTVSSPLNDVHLLPGFVLMVLAVGAALVLRRAHVQTFWWYLVGPGVLSWCACYFSGLHPALALLPVIPFLPHASRDRGMFVDAPPQAHDTLTNFERWWQPPVEGILLLFGLVNAGVPIHGFEEGTWAIPVALLVGRPIGVMIAARVAVASGFHLPQHIGWSEVFVIGCLSAIGLVMSLFFASATLPMGPLLQELKTGALMTAAGAIIAWGAARWLHTGRFTR